MRKRKGAVILALAMMLLLVPVMAQAGTWRQNYIGWWWQEADGSWPSNEWKSINGNWYLFDADGYIRYGWYWDGTNWYYLGGKSDGAMKTGWQVVNGNWYYMYKDGRMAANTWIGSCYVNGSGVWIQNAVKSQWIQSGNRWWYRHPDGSYTANNWETINNKKYHFDANGWMQTGWQKIDGTWYYLGPAGDGAMRSSRWVEECYLGADGKMLTSCWVDDYYVGVSGKIAKSQWVGDSYVGADGKKVSSQWVGDYYVGEDGTYVKNQWVGDYYVGSDGKYEKNQWIGDSYVDENGKKVRNKWIGNRYLDADGKWDRTKPVPVPLEGIKVSTTGTLLKPGTTSGIDLYFFPENTTDDRTATWKSSDESVATVEDGIVTGHKAGYATITVTVGDKSEKIEYLVVPANPSELTMKIAYYTSDASCVKFGESAQVSVFLQPGNFDITSYATISVDDENILKTNDGVGSLWSVGIGETTVRAAYEDLEVSSPVKVVSEDGDLQELSFDKKILYLEKNQTGSIRLRSKPAVYANSQAVKWGSTDENVVTWDPVYGLLAKKPGRATIYAEIMGKRAECEVVVTGGEDVVEYSYDTEYAQTIFDEVNKLRVANGVEPFVWKEEDALYASKVRAGIYEKNGDPIYDNIETRCLENESTQDVQIACRTGLDYVEDYLLDAMMQDSSCLMQFMKQTDQPLTAGCAVVVKKVDGRVENRTLVFTIGASESELGQYTQQERKEYWANWMGILPEDADSYLF